MRGRRAWKKPEKMFSGEKGGHCPPFLIFFNQPEKGVGVRAPPNFWSHNRNLLPTHQKKLQNTKTRRKTPKTIAKLPQHEQKKHWETPENAAKRRKTLQNAAKRRKYHGLVISLFGTKYLGGLENPAPFSGLLKLIVDQNWGATDPFPP